MFKFILCFFLLTTSCFGAGEPIPLWPHGAPGDQGTLEAEKDTSKPNEGLVAGRPLIRLGNVSNPTLTVYRPAMPAEDRIAVVIFPGGGYTILAIDLEGTEVCDWLNSIGVTAVLVKYRVPGRKGQPIYAAPLQDGQRAMGLVRAHAAEWGINPGHIGVLGFSAGAHLAAAVSNNFSTRTYPKVDEADEVSSRPDFTFLIYPWRILKENQGPQLGPEIGVSAKTPPTFLVQTEDDEVKVENSLAYFQALKNVKVPVEMHLYSKGGHGYGLRTTELPVTGWPNLARIWLQGLFPHNKLGGN
jgi:acetyl esterase/lipase